MLDAIVAALSCQNNGYQDDNEKKNSHENIQIDRHELDLCSLVLDRLSHTRAMCSMHHSDWRGLVPNK